MTDFAEKISALTQINFDKVLDVAASFIPRENWGDVWRLLSSGKTVIEDENRLNCYLVSYGEMHRAKLMTLLPKVINPIMFSETGVSVVDWGCGQGLATAVFLDHLASSVRPIRVRASRLIEVSNAARSRASTIVGKYQNVENVREVKWVPGEAISGISLDLPEGVPVVHLFSNILDVEAIDLKMLKRALDETRSAGNATIISVGIYKGHERINAFWSMFGKPKLIHDYRHHLPISGRLTSIDGCSCYGIAYQLTRLELPRPVGGQKLPIASSKEASKFDPCQPERFRSQVAQPPPQEKIQSNEIPLPERPGKFTRVFAPGFVSGVLFDFGREHADWCAYEFSTLDDSLLYNINMDDVAPFYAVINNFIVRGRPSYAPILVEDELARRVGIGERFEDGFGGIKYRLAKDSPSREEIYESLKKINPAAPHGNLSPIDVKTHMQAIVPLMVARVQHAILRGFMGGRFDGCNGTIRVIAIERDVPCVQLALASLEEMFDNLSAMCRDGERGAGKIHYEVETIALDRAYDAMRDPESFLTNLDDSIRNRRYDVALDVSFFHNPEAELMFDKLGFLPAFAARLRTAFHVDERDFLFQVCTAANIVYRPLLSRTGNGKLVVEPCAENLRYFLQNIFRKLDFRDGQLPILDRALRCRSVIGLLPTGGGKSLTYQLATMMQPGIALVIDPLQSLMKDQMDGLMRIGIDACQYINATLKGKAAEEAIGRTVSGNCKFIFISPERLSMPSYRHVLSQMYTNGLYFSYGVIDEVHCVSEWGHDFRPFYLHLGRNLHDFARVKDSFDPNGKSTRYIPLFGLTATASFDVLSDVQRELAGRNAEELESDAIVRYENTNRLELQYRVVKIANPKKNEHINKIAGHQRRVDELKALIERDKTEIKNGAATAGMRTLLRNHEQEIKMHESGAPGRSTLHSAKNNFRAYVGSCKLMSINGILYEQEELFNELLTSSSIDFIKTKFLEREEIRKDDPLYAKVMEADLQVSFANANWQCPDPKSHIYKGAGLVFCPYKGKFSRFADVNEEPSPMSVEGIYKKLASEYGDAVRFFTSSIKGDEEFESKRWKNQQDFIESKAGLMVATSAFGMGIDKPNIRFVIEINHPVSLESFVQEAGRAGRDRKMAVATLLFSDASQNDLDVSEYFHKQSFIGIRPEKKELLELFDKKELEREETSSVEEGKVNGFLEELLKAKNGEVRIFQIVVPKPPEKKRFDDKNDLKDPKALLDKLIYRLCCIGVIEDVECMYGADETKYRLTMVRRDEEDYYDELRKFLQRYYPPERAMREVSLARERKGQNAIHRCVGYLTDFVYGNIERKRARAMQDMHAFCMEGCRPLRMKNDGSMETWLDINEDLKDWIYFYFNSKYARSGYQVMIGDKPQSFSLVDDTDHGKLSDLSLVEKYMRIADDELLEHNSPKDNVKHLQGAVRLIRRAAMETNPTLSLLNVFCLCYLGFRDNEMLIEECIRSLGSDGFGAIIADGNIPAMDVWIMFDKFSEEIEKKAPCAEWKHIVEAARVDIHMGAVRRLSEWLS